MSSIGSSTVASILSQTLHAYARLYDYHLINHTFSNDDTPSHLLQHRTEGNDNHNHNHNHNDNNDNVDSNSSSNSSRNNRNTTKKHAPTTSTSQKMSPLPPTFYPPLHPTEPNPLDFLLSSYPAAHASSWYTSPQNMSSASLDAAVIAMVRAADGIVRRFIKVGSPRQINLPYWVRDDIEGKNYIYIHDICYIC